MLILSKHRDYYDSAIGAGIDKTIVYNRHEKILSYSKNIVDLFGTKKDYYKNKYIKFPVFNGKGKYDLVEPFVIGFCGKLFIGYKLIEKITYSHNIDITYDFDIVESNILFNENKYDWNLSNKKVELYNFVDKINSIDASNIFREYKTPVFSVGHSYYKSFLDENSFHINPILKEYEFVKLYDPYTTFQEIQQYISGVLGVDNILDETIMTEKDKVTQHGFDVKYGFRKRPK